MMLCCHTKHSLLHHDLLLMNCAICFVCCDSIAFLSFGLSEPELLCVMNGLAWIALGAGEMTVYLKFPELFGP